QINIILQVMEAIPREHKEENGKKTLTPGWVRFQVFKTDDHKKSLIKHNVASCSQAEFVEILKNGKIPEEYYE
ncbi:hypothetical protein KAR91_32670, partial [Candidatus Pacearchaeota archaeon]|nr:hypothetical protein [Candidatus Pacearchaeota archaeon]